MDMIAIFMHPDTKYLFTIKGPEGVSFSSIEEFVQHCRDRDFITPGHRLIAFRDVSSVKLDLLA